MNLCFRVILQVCDREERLSSLHEYPLATLFEEVCPGIVTAAGLFLVRVCVCQYQSEYPCTSVNVRAREREGGRASLPSLSTRVCC